MQLYANTNVSDLALCQKCPALLAYKFHLGEQTAWRVGIQGSGYAYGQMFHKYISRVFFEAASQPFHRLHRHIRDSFLGKGLELETVIREYIFFPFVENNPDLKSEQIISMAEGIIVWVKAMSEFFSCIPSLNKEPDLRLIFAEPEYSLRSTFTFNEGKIHIAGRYDALMFNPDRSEARLFEFKGYKRSNVTVTLSQSLMYSWLLWKNTGIIPSVEIIYLDEEEKKPDIFDAGSVFNMMKLTLPKLFWTAFNVLTLRTKPENLHNRNLCRSCKYRYKCGKDMTNLFSRPRTGSSFVSVLVFFLIALVLTAQTFFFVGNSAESISDEREMIQVRLKLDELVDEGIEAVKGMTSVSRDVSLLGSYMNGAVYSKFYSLFADATLVWSKDNVGIFDLYYTLMCNTQLERTTGEQKWKRNEIEDRYRRIFPAMGKNYFLIRARQKLSSGNYIMYQVVVDNSGKIKSFEEVFYNEP